MLTLAAPPLAFRADEVVFFLRVSVVVFPPSLTPAPTRFLRPTTSWPDTAVLGAELRANRDGTWSVCDSASRSYRARPSQRPSLPSPRSWARRSCVRATCADRPNSKTQGGFDMPLMESSGPRTSGLLLTAKDPCPKEHDVTHSRTPWYHGPQR